MDVRDWAVEAGPFRALSFTFRVRCTDAAVGAYLARVLVDLADPTCSPDHVYSFVDAGPTEERRYRVWFDDERIGATAFPQAALRAVLWHVNRQTITGCTERVLVHAAAVEHAGMAALFPAPMESGKTTLAAGLLARADVRYVTDEAVAIDSRSGHVTPFPKALTIDEGSWAVLPELAPEVDPVMTPFLRGQWHVPASAIRPDAVSGDAVPGVLVSPRYDPTAATRLEPLRRAEALALLVDNAFNLSAWGRAGFDVLAELVRGCECYRLSVSDLDDAVHLVATLVGADIRLAEAR